jgi:hypothetical protein
MGVLEHFMGVPLQGYKIMEGIYLRQTTGMDKAHEEVPDVCPEVYSKVGDGHYEGVSY